MLSGDDAMFNVPYTPEQLLTYRNYASFISIVLCLKLYCIKDQILTNSNLVNGDPIITAQNTIGPDQASIFACADANKKQLN